MRLTLYKPSRLAKFYTVWCIMMIIDLNCISFLDLFMIVLGPL